MGTAKEELVYLDTCVYSNLLKSEFAGLRHTLRNMTHRVVFSQVHLEEMKGAATEYADLIEELGAQFIRNPGAANGHIHPIACLEPADIERRFDEAASLEKVNQAFDVMLQSMHYLIGGQRDRTIQEVSAGSDQKIQNLLMEYIAAHVPEEYLDVIDLDLGRIRKASKSLEDLDIEEILRTCSAQVKSARDGDPMRNMTPMEKVQHLFSITNADDYKSLTTSFPQFFARNKILTVGELTGFAFALFSLGLTKRKGIFSGPAQERKFAAQFRDCRHIEEAALCNVFVTFDHGAAELALVTYAYSGFNATSVLLETEKKIAS